MILKLCHIVIIVASNASVEPYKPDILKKLIYFCFKNSPDTFMQHSDANETKI